MTSKKKIPVAPTTGGNKSNCNIVLISKNLAPRHPWRARVPFKPIFLSGSLLASKLFREAKG